jgi:hypothetical protein
LRGEALSSIAASLVNREACKLELVNMEQVEALIYTLDSCGAQFEFKFLRPNKVIQMDHNRKGAEVKTATLGFTRIHFGTVSS